MKKIVLAGFAVLALTFFSCEVESVGEDSLNSVGLTSEDCDVSLLPDLPAVVNACVTAKGTNANNSYFDLNISDTALAGDYSAWCIDQDATLENGDCFVADVYSSYDTLPIGALEKPENLDLLNWLYNQNLIGQPSSGGALYTFGDFQRAVWYLVDDSNCEQCLYLGDWNEDRALELVALATTNGEGYEPGAGEKLLVVLIPTNGMQAVFIPYTLECENEPVCETAFARDVDGNNCFIDNGFSRWGWAIGPLAEGTVASYDFYAGAGQCDISKGELVGTVDVSYVDGNVTVTYNIADGYVASETHTYAGNAMFPTMKNGKETVAPGQYEIQENLSGDIYVIAHAEVCTD